MKNYTLTPINDTEPIEVLVRGLARFWNYVAPHPSGCWVWTGGKLPGGYGQWCGFHFGGLHVERVTHRFAYQCYIGEIPEGMTLDHTCEEPACCNPFHLEVVTLSENSRRMWQRKKARLAKNFT